MKKYTCILYIIRPKKQNVVGMEKKKSRER